MQIKITETQKPISFKDFKLGRCYREDGIHDYNKLYFYIGPDQVLRVENERNTFPTICNPAKIKEMLFHEVKEVVEVTFSNQFDIQNTII